jgi:hypothetical protein
MSKQICWKGFCLKVLKIVSLRILLNIYSYVFVILIMQSGKTIVLTGKIQLYHSHCIDHYIRDIIVIYPDLLIW